LLNHACFSSPIRQKKYPGDVSHIAPYDWTHDDTQGMIPWIQRQEMLWPTSDQPKLWNKTNKYMGIYKWIPYSSI
jgi:hypothetical protein